VVILVAKQLDQFDLCDKYQHLVRARQISAGDQELDDMVTDVMGITGRI
jgi:hypothetical protein